jgi:hypothetical protein
MRDIFDVVNLATIDIDPSKLSDLPVYVYWNDMVNKKIDTHR